MADKELLEIDTHLQSGAISDALQSCITSKNYNLGLLIGKLSSPNVPRYYELMADIIKNVESVKTEIKLVQSTQSSQALPALPKRDPNKIRVQLLCNWCPSQELANLWNKMSKGNYTWNNIEIVWEGVVDYFVLINAIHPNIKLDKKRTILFRMEPHMAKNPETWKEWADPDPKDFLRVLKHESGDYNNNEWHLSKTYSELSTQSVEKNLELNGILSTILSAQYRDPGHVKRVDFVKFLEKKGLTVHVFGDNKWEYVNYKGSLPKYCKDGGIFPYKYTFNAENHAINNYYTEKLIDGILGECLTFYWGCPNVKEYIDPRAYVQLDLSNFEKDYDIIKKAIAEDWHSQRLPYIREAKKKILNELQFFPRLEKIIEEIRKPI